MTPVFDTLRIAQILKEAGFDDQQSEAVVTAIRQSLTENVTAIRQSLTENVATKGDIANLRADMYRAFWLQGAALVGAIAAGVGIALAIVRAIS